jgi:ubiquinone/menaquinone biosynthesis C-methylase UbiE
MPADAALPATHPVTVRAYSSSGAPAYEEPLNRRFLYGDITTRFVNQIPFTASDRIVLDIGCGTGFVFDQTAALFARLGIAGIGVEPAMGMLDIARAKHGGNPRCTFAPGSFECLPLADGSVDRIVSTLALHWVKSVPVAAQEMRRVLRPGGAADLLMIARDDGARFKRAVVAAQRRHLSFAQIIATAGLVQRLTPLEAVAALEPFADAFSVDVRQFDEVVFGTFEQHMAWWLARSSPIIAEVADRNQFMADLRAELLRLDTEAGIPFDASYLWITIRSNRP